MKLAMDRLYATLAYVQGFVNEDQLRSAYERHQRGESSSVLQALLEQGALRDLNRKPLENAVVTCLARTVDGLLVAGSAGQLRQFVRDDPIWRDFFAQKLPGPSRRGRYQVEKVIGAGGMGQVWRATDPVLGRTVALKELKPGVAENTNTQARFLREARITGRLEHPFIVPVHELQAEDGLYYVMRLVDGVPLSDAIKTFHQNGSGSRPFDLAKMLKVFENVCEAIAFAHTKGIIHRDLKPENIIVGNFGEVFVLDWGLAKVVSGADKAIAEMDGASGDTTELTKPRQALGTPRFMSPEQAAGRSQEAQPACDIFGLGGILFAILTGSAPHARHASLPLPQVLQRIATEPVPPACEVCAGVPKPLEAVCAKAMALDPRDRYENALDLADDVRRWSVGESVAVYEEPRSTRFRRWAEQHPRGVLGAAAVVLAIVVAATAFGVAAWRDETALQQILDRELTTRGQMFRHDLLSDIRFTASGTMGDAQAPLVRSLVTGEGLDGTWADARRRHARFWQSWMQARSHFLALSLVDRQAPERTILRVKRDRTGGEITVLVPETAPQARAREAIAEVLAAVDRGPGPHLLRRSDDPGKPQVELVTVARVDVKGHDAWLVSEFDLTSVMAEKVAPGDGEILTVLRDRNGELLIKGGANAESSVYGMERLGEGVDPRLVHFFATDASTARPQENPTAFPPADQGDEGTFLFCKPNDDIIHVCKIHYNPETPKEYVSLTLVAPYESYRTRSFARRDFLFLLVALMLGAVLVVVFLAGRLFRQTKPTAR